MISTLVNATHDEEISLEGQTSMFPSTLSQKQKNKNKKKNHQPKSVASKLT